MLVCPKCVTGWEFGAPAFLCPDCQVGLIDVAWSKSGNYVVQFEGDHFKGCNEAVIRNVNLLKEDNLGCKVSRIRPIEEVKIRPMLWDKDGALRCEVDEI